MKRLGRVGLAVCQLVAIAMLCACGAGAGQQSAAPLTGQSAAALFREKYEQALPAYTIFRDPWALELDGGAVATVDGADYVQIRAFRTVAEMQDMFSAHFSEDFCTNTIQPHLFDEGEFGAGIREIDGKLYLRTSFGGSGNEYEPDVQSAVAVALEEMRVVVELPATGPGGAKAVMRFVLVRENGAWLFDGWGQVKE